MPQNSSVPRTTEGPRPGAVNRGKRGRPPGSKNKPKGLVPAPLADDILRAVEPILPPEQVRYLKAVVKDGKGIDTKKELDTLILLLNRSLWPALVAEASPEATDEAKEGDWKPIAFRKDVTERLKVLNSLLALRNQVEKREDGEGDGDIPPLLRMFRERGMDTRVAVLIEARDPQTTVTHGSGPEPDSTDSRGSSGAPRLGPVVLDRDADGTERFTDEA